MISGPLDFMIFIWLTFSFATAISILVYHKSKIKDASPKFIFKKLGIYLCLSLLFYFIFFALSLYLLDKYELSLNLS